MKTPISFQSVLLVLFFIVFKSPFSTTQITPWVNKTAHYSSPVVMSLSDDGKYLLSGDKDGYIAIRDMETKKMVRSYHTKEKLQALFFKKNSYDVISIYSENEWLKITSIDFKTEIKNNLFVRSYIGNSFKMDVSENKDVILIVNDELYQEVSISGQSARIQYTNLGIIESHFTQEGTVERTEFIDSNYTLVTDLNNRTVYWNKVDSTYECADHLRGYKVILKEDIFINKNNVPSHIFKSKKSKQFGRIPIKINFKYSPDGKQIALITKIKSKRELIIYSVPHNKVKWRKTFPGGLVTSSEIAWLNNERLLFTAIPSYISEYNQDGDFLEPIQNDYSILASVEINDDLSKILYSSNSLDTATYEFDLLNPNKKNRIDSAYNEFLLFDETEKIYYSNQGAIPCVQHKLQTRKDGEVDTIDLVIPYFEIDNIHSFDLGNRLIYTAKTQECLNGTISGNPDSLIITDTGEKYGFIFNSINFIDLHGLYHQGGIEDPILSISGNHIIIHDIKEDKKTVILNSRTSDLKSNFNGTQILFNSNQQGHHSYNLINEKLEKLDQENLSFLSYAQSSPMACRITASGQLKVWDSQTNDTTYVFSNPSVLSDVSAIAFLEEENKLLLLSQGKIFNIDYKQPNAELKVFYSSLYDIKDFILSKDKSYIYTESQSSNSSSAATTSSILNRRDLSLIYEYSFKSHKKQNSKSLRYNHVSFSENNSRCMLYDGLGQYKLINLEKRKLLLTLRLFDDGDWLAYTPEGYFDASKKGRESLYYVLGDQVILYSQIKERLWEPDLIKKLLKDPNYYNDQELGEFPLYPESEIRLVENTDKIKISLQEKTGGIGQLSLYINDKEVNEDINPGRLKEDITVSLLDYQDYLYSNGLNKIGVKTYNSAGWISSRINYLYLETNLESGKDTTTNNAQFTNTTRRRRSSSSIERPGFYGLFIGSSKYNNPDLLLDFADKDALALKDAFNLIGEGMYNPKRTSFVKLTSDAESIDSTASRKNILNALSFIKDRARVNDIVVLFLSGHGITLEDDFYYLTTQAGKVDLATDSVRRSQVCISSKEILEYLREIKANKQILILDACHSGKIADFLQNKPKALSTSQQKALESLKDKMGTYILASSEANQKSYEVKTLKQGLLTHSLLLGMSGEADDSGTIDIIKLLNYASRQTEQVSQNVMGISQRPVVGIGEGGSSFDIGFKNNSLKPPIPSEYVKFIKGRFGVFPSLSDPINFEKTFNHTLVRQGIFGGTQEFIFLKNDADNEAYKLTGTYEVLDNDSLNIKLYIINNNKVVEGPFEFSTPKNDIKATLNAMILKAVRTIKGE